MLINRSPEIMQFAANAHEHLVEKPFVTGFRPAPLERVGVGPSEAQAPLTDGLVADHDASRRQDQFDCCCPRKISSTSRRLKLKQ